jgi:hypothetical protein
MYAYMYAGKLIVCKLVLMCIYTYVYDKFGQARQGETGENGANQVCMYVCVCVYMYVHGHIVHACTDSCVYRNIVYTCTGMRVYEHIVYTCQDQDFVQELLSMCVCMLVCMCVH